MRGAELAEARADGLFGDRREHRHAHGLQSLGKEILGGVRSRSVYTPSWCPASMVDGRHDCVEQGGPSVLAKDPAESRHGDSESPLKAITRPVRELRAEGLAREAGL